MGSTESFLGRVASNNQKDMSEEKPTGLSDPAESPPPFLGRRLVWFVAGLLIGSVLHLDVSCSVNQYEDEPESGARNERSDPRNDQADSPR